MNPIARERRFSRMRSLGCIACWLDKRYAYPEIHHLNLDGKAGQKRRGDEFTIPLCGWHHQGTPYFVGVSRTREIMGPSLKLESKKFRERYGSDDVLLELTNEQIEGKQHVNSN